ncbi:MAG: cbb3-type cytochrome oxidase assembly protein CcoS [Bacteroidales bacterium]|nr:cbb3-type cytochrome oxidase assembly protein CcoS [Bacteroidales bacterium]
MIVIFILIGLSLFVAIIFLFVFIWNVKSGQYEDDYTPSVRMLFDDKKKDNKEQKNKDTQTTKNR